MNPHEIVMGVVQGDRRLEVRQFLANPSELKKGLGRASDEARRGWLCRQFKERSLGDS